MELRTTIRTCLAVAAGILLLTAIGFFRYTQRVNADVPPVTAVYTPVRYTPILPSLTDGGHYCEDPLPNDAIGCNGIWSIDYDNLAVNSEHYLYYPEGLETDGKLLVFLCGGDGKAEFCENVYPAAAERGYHVIGLTYPGNVKPCEQNFSCFGDFLLENITGDEHSAESHISEHPQDSVVRRLIAVLEWASDTANNPPGHPGDLGWSRYLTGTPGHHGIDWTKVNLAGFSNGSSTASRMGMVYPNVGRVALFAGPNDGRVLDTGVWKPASYITPVPGLTDERYYGLVHFRNKSTSCADDKLFKVKNNWTIFGMGTPTNGTPVEFDPTPGETPYFGDAHMLISMDPCKDEDDALGTSYKEAHESVVRNHYCTEFILENDKYRCEHENGEDAWDGDPVGYESAWRCVLGAGHSTASGRPIANAGAPQTVECQGNGGANVGLDGSGTKDYDCEFLRYAWSGPFGSETGRNPTVFCPLGINFVSLTASDDWWSSLVPSTTTVNVVDTTPPSLQVTITPTALWPADHRLVRIDATVSVADSCGGASPHVVLTSVTSDQPDNGVADGDTINDVQGAEIGTDDRSFFVRAERAGNDPNGRTYTIVYTATDASGNQTQATATVRVPFSM